MAVIALACLALAGAVIFPFQDAVQASVSSLKDFIKQRGQPELSAAGEGVKQVDPLAAEARPALSNAAGPSLGTIFAQSPAVAVNGETITRKEVDIEYERLPAENRRQVSKERFTEDYITKRLLLQKATEEDVSVSDRDVEGYISRQEEVSGKPVVELEAKLSEMGYTMDDYKKDLKELLTVSKLLDQELGIQDVKASKGEVDDYLAEHSQEFSEIFEEGDQDIQDRLRERITMKLTKEKQDQLITDYITGLRQDAEFG